MSGWHSLSETSARGRVAGAIARPDGGALAPGDLTGASHGTHHRCRERAARPAAGPGRPLADGTYLHRAEQDSRARLPARRDHGPPDVRRGDLPAADG